MYKYYVLNASIENGNEFNFGILEKDNRGRNIRFINEKDSLKIRVDASQENTILIVNQWEKRSGTLFSGYDYATLVEIIVATEEIKREWEKIIEIAAEKQENLLKPKNVIPRLI